MGYPLMLVPKTYNLLLDAIEAGVAHGARRVNEGIEVDTLKLDENDKEIIGEEVLSYILEAFHIFEQRHNED